MNYCANGDVEDLNLYCYKKVISKITGWPLGHKPQGSDEVELHSIAKKAELAEKVLVYSPHPDDDVISMGATIKNLHEQGHEVHVAYMTSGANGVFDHDLFSIIWGPTVAALSYVFDKSSDKAVIQRALHGFQRCATIAAHYHMSDVFDNLIISLCKFTTLMTVSDAPAQFIPVFGRNGDLFT